jgi:hypothetical protein
MAKKNLLDVDIDQNKLSNSADYEVKAKDWLINQGADYGITEDMIGWNSDKKMITLGGQDFMAPGRLENGSSYVSNDDIRSNLDNWVKSRGIQSKSQQYDLSNYGYDNPYKSTIDEILQSVLNPKAFQYDVNSDPSFQSYQQQYGRAGDRALTNTMSEATGMTGGRLNSWAVSAGNQAKQNWDDRLMDVIPQLENMAYGRYQDGINSQRNNLNTLLDIDNNDFRRAMEARSFDYGLDRDSIADTRYTDETKYSRGRDELADKRYDTEWDYGLNRDAIADARYDSETAWNQQMDRDANARGWANTKLSREQFEYQKEKDAKAIADAANDTDVEPDLFGEFYTQMYSGVIIDESGNVIKEDVTPEEWLKHEARYLPENVVVKLEEIIRKNKSTGNTFTIIPN